MDSPTPRERVRDTLFESIDTGSVRLIADAMNLTQWCGFGIPEPRDTLDLECYRHMSARPEVWPECRHLLKSICDVYG